ncbi:MAG: ABC transporter ATP-binding protein [Bacillota bacterium]|nr:ABC transporter ATP-binding protein [Bacillota bacterium]
MIRSLKRILHWAKDYRKRLILGCICSFFSVWSASLPILIAAWALGRVLADQRGEAMLDGTTIALSFGGIVLSILLRFFFSYWKARLQESIGDEVAAEERLRIGDILKRVSLGYFTEHSTGDILTTITGDLSALELMGMKLIDAVVNGYISLIAILTMMAFFFPTGALAIVGGAAVSWLFLNLISKHSRHYAPIKQKSQTQLTDAALEYIHGLPLVKSYGQEGISIASWMRACEHHKKTNLDIEHGVVPNNCAHLTALKLASVLLILLAGVSAVQGGMSLANFLMVALFAFLIFGSVETMSDSVYMLGLIDASMDKLEAIHHARFIDEDGGDLPLERFDIRFRDVSFSYGERTVLHHLDFTIPEHSMTAIVGASGSGKSTICHLMTRFYDVDRGSIEVGGIDVRRLTCDSLLKHISMVFQSVYLFQDTVRNNIRFGKADASEEELIAAAKKARCHDFILALPDGYDTVIGEGGSSLSGGEKQRISIARAILKDAPIILLDEATASIDPENEHLIQDALSELTRGKTVVTIAHRLNTIEHADQILVIDEGRLVQSGTHSELSTREGIYRDFIEIRQRAEGWRLPFYSRT